MAIADLLRAAMSRAARPIAENPVETAEFGFALTAKNRPKRMGLASLGSRGDAQTRAAASPECLT